MSNRTAPRLEVGLGLALLAAYAALLPTGMPEPQVAAEVARAVTLTPGAESSALAVLPLRAAALLPAGAVTWRGALAAAVAAALAAALATAWSKRVLGGGQSPADTIAPALRAAVVIPAVATVALTRTLISGRGATAGALVGAGLAAAGLALLLDLLRRPDEQRSGLAFALVAGLCAGAPAAAGTLLWPPGALVTVWALRRGARWPLLAPVLFVAAAAVALTALAGPDALGARGLAALAARPLHAFARPDGAAVLAELEALARQLGILALLMAGLGLVRLLLEDRLAFALCGWALAAAIIMLALGAPGERGGALPVALVALAAPLAVGIRHLAARFGRARLHAAAVLGVLAVAWPAVDGTSWLRDRGTSTAVTAALLDHRLATAEPRARLTVPPELSGWIELQRAAGRRPDLVIVAGRSPASTQPPSR